MTFEPLPQRGEREFVVKRTMRTAGFLPLRLRSWIVICFGHLLFLLLLGTLFACSSGEYGMWRESTTRSSEEEHHLFQAYSAGLPLSLRTNLTENIVLRRRRRNLDADDGADLPQSVLTSSHLSSLRALVSDKKITVRLGLHVSLTGPSELMDPDILLSLGKEPGIYNTGGEAGVFSMRVLEVKRRE